MKTAISIILICTLLAGCSHFPYEHVLISLGSTATGEALGNCWAGASAGAAIFWGREQAQDEQRLIQRFYGNQRSNMPPLAGFYDTRAWDHHSITDFVYPTIAAYSTCALIYAYKKGWFGWKWGEQAQ